jgi:uncharacterized repeat protein (TIGR01451 family)
MRGQITSLGKFLFVVFVVSGVCVASLPLPTVAEPPTPTPPHPRPGYEGLENLPHRALTTLQTAPQGNVASAQLAAWSKIVFESYRDDNWEIYLASGDGSNQTRLTYDGAADIQPRLNRGCTRIAFASKRTGNYEIFTMNTDGSGLTQLTANGTDDVNSSWSPDGTKIAFEAYRDGQAEIYIMNADGSGQTRLTWDGAYDGEPAWSPGGTRIAFTSKRSGGYAIWVMNADGSGQMQLSWQPYSENPTWSPDGTQIAYDSDGDGDGWQELWLMNADGSNQRQVYDPWESETDAWARSWSPDGQYVAFTRISWIYYEGNWYWMTAYLDAWDSLNPWNAIRLSSQGTDFYPDWQTTDVWAPTSRVNTLPSYARNGVLISWGGSDSGGSGIKTYDVQYRDMAGGSWTDWQMGTTQTSASFSSTAGHTYYFRSRSRDSAQNMESWPSGDGDTSTTLYAWRVTGTVRDNAGTPVVGAAVTTTPDAFHSALSDANGVYTAYVATDSATYATKWAKSGYGGLPATDFTAAEDAHVDVVLPPSDNVVRDGGFESGSLTAGDWMVGGVIAPVVTSNVKHTGNYAAFLGQGFTFAPPLNVSNNPDRSSDPQLAVDESGAVHVVWQQETPWVEVFYARRASDGSWSSPQNISNNPGSWRRPQLAVDRSGAVHVVWQQETPGNPAIFYARRSSDGSWSTPQNISSNYYSEFPQLAVDGGGAVHVVWRQGSEVFYARRSSDGTWSSPQNISNTPDCSESQQLAVDGGGIVHVVWEDCSPESGIDIFYARRSTDGTWSSPQNISNNPGPSLKPQLAADGGGAVHVVWYDDTSGIWEIFYARRSSDGTWSSPQNISNTPDYSASPQLAVDGGGTVHVVWYEQSDWYCEIFYAQRSSDGTWSSPQNISNTPGRSESPRLAVDGVGTVHVVWRDGTPGNDDIFYAKRSSDGTWSSPQNISNTSGASGGSQVAVDAIGTVHVVWSDETTGTSDIFYVGPAPAEQTADSSIAQAVTVPITMSTPTLSFLYQLGGASTTSGSWFSVQVDSGITATTLFSTTTNTDVWAHRWFDLTTWAGQTITMTFNLHQTAGDPVRWVYLDEVTLGSAYPDLWVSKGGPVTARPGEQVVHTITYGNRGGAAASGVRITDTLPSEVSFVDASPPPITTLPLVWEVGDVPARSGPFTIAVTATVDPAAPLFTTLTNTVSIGAVSPELETFNNTAQAATFIGHRLYLPTVMKG